MTTTRLVVRLGDVPTSDPEPEFEMSVCGHWADAVIDDDGIRRPVLVGPGPPTGIHPGEHMERLLRRRRLLGEHAVRLPVWALVNRTSETLCDTVCDRIAPRPQPRNERLTAPTVSPTSRLPLVP